MSAYDKVQEQLRSEPRRWLVTGAAGFIGSSLVETLLGLGQHVVGLDNFVTGHQTNLDDIRERVGDEASRRFRFVTGDICDPAAARRACQEVDIVLHQAALGSVPRSIADPLESHRANVDGFLSMAVAARDAGAKRFVYASSSSVYGDAETLPKREPNIGRPLSPYAATKWINEIYAGVVQDCYGLTCIGLRYFNVFGRRQDPDGPYAAVIPRWINNLIEGVPCEIYGDGSYSRDFCFVDNAVQANILAAMAPPEATNTAYNVGVSGRTTLNELFEIVRAALAEHHPEVGEAQVVYADARAGDIPHSQASIDKLRDALGYEPTHDIRAGLAETVDWYLSLAEESEEDPEFDEAE